MKFLKKNYKHQRNKNNFSKKLVITTFLFFVFCSIAIAQGESGFGINGGLNYNSNGDYFESITDNAEHPEKNTGFHLGVFYKFGKRIYLRPELVYTQTKSDYDNKDFKLKKIDAPLLLGLKVIGPLNVFAGPSFQYILDSNFDGISINNIENDFSVGLNFGVAFNFKRIGIDLRYERGFSDNEAIFLNNNGVDISRIDTRPEQLILSLSVKI